ncbi:MAG TPA: metallophosphoesterase [Solirubrobacteraceae bacterium]|nr:metallophosphoesterase [Solirubrobacteraceae bacterium]
MDASATAPSRPGRFRPRPRWLALGAAALLAALVALLAATSGRSDESAGAERPTPRNLRAASTLSVQALTRDGLLVRLVAAKRTRVVRLRLINRETGVQVSIRRFDIRTGGSVRLRWRFGPRAIARLKSGRHRLRAETGRSINRLDRRTLSRTLVVTDSRSTAPLPSPSSADPVIAAAGDIACPGNCGQDETADLITDVIKPDAVLGLGDYQYDTGTLQRFESYYTPYWGRFRNRTYAINGGSHDFYGTGDYLTYFNAEGPVQLKPEGSYSFDIGAWHVIALNSYCFERDSCDENTWTQWLREDLRANSKRCTLAYFHQPYWTTRSNHDRNKNTQPWIRLLYEADADVILQAHNHVYERFAPQDPDDRRDDARGLEAFTVGSGGRSHYDFIGAPAPNSLVRNADTNGVLKLVLHPGSYDYAFVPEPGAGFEDAGSRRCH